jgi:hypothetical protein
VGLITRRLLYALLALAAVLLPLALWNPNLPFVLSSYGDQYLLFELFGFSAALLLSAIVALKMHKLKERPFQDKLPVLLLLGVGLHYLLLISEYSIRSWDYSCYENAGKAILIGESPYTGAVTGDYLYPPLPAQVLAIGYRLVSGFTTPLPPESQEEAGWYLLFYLYQCAQFFLVLLAFFLSYRFARRVGLKTIPASLLITALFILNTPLVRTLRHNQINLYLLVLILAALLWLKRRPILSGLAAALGGHLKLYPLLLLFPWAITRKTAAVAGVLGFAGILLAQAIINPDTNLWNQYFSFARSSSDGIWFLQMPYFRDNSLHSLVFNLNRTVCFLLGVDNQAHLQIAQAIFLTAALAVVSWFVLRFRSRERIYRGFAGTDDARIIGHSLDAVALTLIVSPLVWEHQYVLALPLVIWAVALRGRDKPWLAGIAAFLMFALPVFDLFPLSYHRLAGLGIMLWLIRPTRVPILSRDPAHFP